MYYTTTTAPPTQGQINITYDYIDWHVNEAREDYTIHDYTTPSDRTN
jgi:hypothetical protein